MRGCATILAVYPTENIIYTGSPKSALRHLGYLMPSVDALQNVIRPFLCTRLKILFTRNPAAKQGPEAPGYIQNVWRLNNIFSRVHGNGRIPFGGILGRQHRNADATLSVLYRCFAHVT